MSTNKLIIRNTLLKKDYGYLPFDFKKGDIVYRYNGCTYGCISPLGIAITLKEGKTPFYEIPILSAEPALDK